MTSPDAPYAVLAELTHRCPLQCPYCSNPVALERAGTELETDTWLAVIDEIADLGALQIHFSGGEPVARHDLERLVARAHAVGLYTNLITSAVLLTEERVHALADAGLDHVQISFQDSEPATGDRIGGYAGGHAKKVAAAKFVRRTELPLTLNFVVHRQNLDRLPEMIDLAVALDARRAEIAHVQYHGWALRNRAALMPSRAMLDRATATVESARERLLGVLTIDYVVPDYYARRPKPCMGGWARRFLNITPSGRVLPCHAAESIPGLRFESVPDRPLADIWRHSDAFRRFRGTDWMPEPCRSCDRKEIDWGGCRCQAFALSGDAANTDPACELSPLHERIVALAETEAASDEPDLVYRNFANSENRPGDLRETATSGAAG